MVWQSIFDVASSLWLVVDMALDCVTTAGFYSKAQNAAEDNIYGAAEFPFFVASIVALFFPTLIGGILLWCYLSYYEKVRNVKLGFPDWMDLYKDCCCSKLCSFWFTSVPLCILGFGLIWIVSPVLHFIQAVIAMFGVQPVGGKDFAIKVCVIFSISPTAPLNTGEGV